jgi:hypothetical protein
MQHSSQATLPEEIVEDVHEWSFAARNQQTGAQIGL